MGEWGPKAGNLVLRERLFEQRQRTGGLVVPGVELVVTELQERASELASCGRKGEAGNRCSSEATVGTNLLILCFRLLAP